MKMSNSKKSLINYFTLIKVSVLLAAVSLIPYTWPEYIIYGWKVKLGFFFLVAAVVLLVITSAMLFAFIVATGVKRVRNMSSPATVSEPDPQPASNPPTLNRSSIAYALTKKANYPAASVTSYTSRPSLTRRHPNSLVAKSSKPGSN